MLLLGNLWSCAASCFVTRKTEAQQLKIRPADLSRKDDGRVYSVLESAWLTTQDPGNLPKLYIVESDDLNAASMGDGRFLTFRSVATVPDPVLAGILAHEVAHDVMSHPRKAAELKDLTDFLAEAVAFFTYSGAETEQTMKDQVSRAALPRFTRNQELEADSVGADIL